MANAKRRFNEVEANGMKLRQTGHYTITEREGERVTMEVTLEQELLDPTVDVPGMIGASARVSGFQSSGQGTVQLDLNYLTPTLMNLTMQMSMVMDVSVLGQDQRMDMDMDMDMTLARDP